MNKEEITFALAQCSDEDEPSAPARVTPQQDEPNVYWRAFSALLKPYQQLIVVSTLLLALVVMLTIFTPWMTLQFLIPIYLLLQTLIIPIYSLRLVVITKEPYNDEFERTGTHRPTNGQRKFFTVLTISSLLTLTLIIILAAVGISSGPTLSGEEPHAFVKFGYVLDVFMLQVATIQLLVDVIVGVILMIAFIQGYSRFRKGYRDSILTEDDYRFIWKMAPIRAAACVFTAIIVTGIAFFGGTVQPNVNELHYNFERLPMSLDELRIVQLSDVHGGPTIGRVTIESIVTQVNSLDADIIVLTGDIIDGKVSTFKAALLPLKKLKSRRGIYLCTGNHEYMVNLQELDKWMEVFREFGIRPLRNERVTIFADHTLTWSNREGLTRYPQNGLLTMEDKELLDYLSLNTTQVEWPTGHQVPNVQEPADIEGFYLAGIEDFSTKTGTVGIQPDPEMSFGNRLDNRTLVVLAHQPSHIFDIAEFRPELVLSGHTHGGQIFPNHIRVALENPYFAGLSRHSEFTQIYVNTGTNQAGPRARLASSREITVHVFHSKK